MMTLTLARPLTALTTPSMSRLTSSQSPDLMAPTLMTMSISRAPLEAPSEASKAFASGVLVPNGKAMTQHGVTPLPEEPDAEEDAVDEPAPEDPDAAWRRPAEKEARR